MQRPVVVAPEPTYQLHFSPETESLTKGVERSFEHSAVSLSGTVTNSAGAAAPGVPVRLWERAGSVGNEGARTEVASTVTDTKGHWVLTAPAGPSRALSVSCGGQAQAATVNAINTVVEVVRPTLSSLRVETGGRGHLTFTGRASSRAARAPNAHRRDASVEKRA